MSDAKIRVSHSQLQTFDRCNFAWHIGYEKGLAVVESKPYLDFGNIVHELLYAYYIAHKAKKTPEECWEAVKVVGAQKISSAGTNTDNLSLVTRGIRLVRRYCTEFAVYWDRGWTTLGVEYHFVIPLTSPGGIEYELEGYIDWVAQDPTGRIWITDHKTVGNKFWTDTEVMMDPQIPFYCIGLRELGKPVYGIMYNMLNSYDYKDFDATDKEKLFKRVSSYRKPEELDKILEEMGLTVDEMVAVQETNIRRRSLKKECAFCQHQELCLVDLKGIDVDSVIQARYKDKSSDRKQPLDINAAF